MLPAHDASAVDVTQPDSAALWQHAVDLGAQGSYAEAEQHAVAIGERVDRWSSLALSTRASHLRQVGAPSIALDQRAADCAVDDESSADALVGLAADCVGMGDVDPAVSWHVEAARVARDWRTRTRWHWVGAEIAMLTGDRTMAREHARRAVLTSSGRSDRHHAKSLIVACATSGDLAGMDAVLDLVTVRGWHTLVWPLALVVADHADERSGAWAEHAWAAGARATHVIEQGLPPRLVDTWRSHPGVQRLRASDRPLTSE